MKITVEDFKKLLSHLISCISHLQTGWYLKQDCVLTRDVEYSLHKRQNSRDDNLCKNDVQVGIYLKLLLIKLNFAVFLLIAKG